MTTNKFATLNLKNRAEAKATEFNLTGVSRELFVFIATQGDVHFDVIMNRFGMYRIEEWVGAMSQLMTAGLVHQMESSDRYYAIAI